MIQHSVTLTGDELQGLENGTGSCWFTAEGGTTIFVYPQDRPNYTVADVLIAASDGHLEACETSVGWSTAGRRGTSC
jgi:hypothetical protein